MALISIIIPCYNHGHYLAAAIESIFKQNIKEIEIIVVDDGSDDDTKMVTAQFKEVRYIHQHNQGLSAARNTGIKNSTGNYLVFLDADDWLLDDALATNLYYLNTQDKLAFVSGAHQTVHTYNNLVEYKYHPVLTSHFNSLLEGNYIGMHATVMYQKWVFDSFAFDTTLKACEDYDLYLKIARKHPVMHHDKCLAAYRLHQSNMSGDVSKMLHYALLVLQTQYATLVNDTERRSYQKGLRYWKNYYTNLLYCGLMASKEVPKADHIEKVELLRKHNYFLYLKIKLKSLRYVFKR